MRNVPACYSRLVSKQKCSISQQEQKLEADQEEKKHQVCYLKVHTYSQSKKESYSMVNRKSVCGFDYQLLVLDFYIRKSNISGFNLVKQNDHIEH